MEKSREARQAEKEGLSLTPRRVLPTPKPMEAARKEPVHAPSEIHERLARNLQIHSEGTSKTGARAAKSVEIARNIDDHKVRWGEPLPNRFRKLVASL